MTSEAFSVEYKTYFSCTAKLVSVHFGVTPDEAEDVAQSAWTRAWAKSEQFRGDCSFRTWVSKIAIREYLSRKRSEKCRPRSVGPMKEDGSSDPWFDERHDSRLDASRVLQFVPEGTLRRVMEMHYLQDFEVEKIRQIEGASTAGAVKTWLFRAREQARKNMRLSWVTETGRKGTNLNGYRWQT